ncbi:MAG: nitrous oxide reductase family maturation protein NosD [Planctomycetota bacterium]|jgi:nitrous oxidase accessory protein
MARLVLALVVLAAPVPAATLRVGPGGHATIGAALEAAAPGDTIVVEKGVYEERLVVAKSVKLIGEGDPTIFGGYQGDVVLVRADDVELRGFVVKGSGKRMMTSQAGVKIHGAHARIVGNRIVDNLFGVYLKGCKHALIERNTVEGRADASIGLRGAGIHLFDALHNTIRENRVSHVRDGVYFDHADFNTVERNEFFELRYGVHYMYCKDNSFFDNVFRDSMGGVAVMYTERVTFRGNQMVGNRRGFNSFGLLLKDCIDSVAEENVILNNTRGIFLDGAHRNVLRRNLIAYNDVGIFFYASALKNRFSENDFIGNLSTLYTVGRAKADWTPDGVGNYFSDYAGYDLDGDGRGDTEHRLQDAFEYLVGNRELLHLFLNSAAADALALAERSFPLVPTSDQRDLAPFMKPVSGVSLDLHGTRERGFSLFAAGSVLVFAAAGWLLIRWRA